VACELTVLNADGVAGDFLSVAEVLRRQVTRGALRFADSVLEYKNIL